MKSAEARNKLPGRGQQIGNALTGEDKDEDVNHAMTSTERSKVFVCILSGVEPFISKGWTTPIQLPKEFTNKNRLNLCPLMVSYQVFVALIRKSPRLRGAPQLVQRLLD
jgi:hypothetical protein